MAHDEQRWLTPRLLKAATLCNQTPTKSDSPLWLGIDLGTCDVVSMVVDSDGQPVAVCLDWADVVRDGIVWDFFGAVTIVRRHLDTLEQQLGCRFTHAATSFPPGTDPRISINVLESAGLEVSHVLDEPTAVADLLQLDNAGVVDIGGGTMDIAVYTGGALRHTKVIPYAGNVVTSDIAYAFGTPPSDAEAIKVRHGCALGSIVGKDESVEVPSVGGRPPRSLQRQTLAEVIEPRYTELLNLVNEEILQLQEQLRQQGVKHHLAAGIVLTGGAAQIEGLAACAQRVFHTQVRIGAPLNITGLTDYAQEPYYSTAVGLLHYGKESHLSGEAEVEKRVTASVGSWIKRLNSWLRKEF